MNVYSIFKICKGIMDKYKAMKRLKIKLCKF